MDKIIVAVTGIGLIAFIYWFFFGKKEEAGEAESGTKILVDGGYKPNIIKIKKDQKTKLIFLRKDENSCLEELIFPDFKIKEYLPLNEEVGVELEPQKRGTFEFHCGMNMFRGKVVVQ